ncbi:hypothetical protein NRK68_06450 [Streptomyces yangpuensis]|uniref:Uncharacterized protein n=1 Tax=Streptomyces yangpuensis TaxID=1648182 RepID=A0ABY5PS25_9ACTN|nr:hypothetical protein [Streptomyces yangpuensis]UUY46886.1 hypothetical protein NRK68_06450 [Streptomyces yangpuensis]
MTFVKQRRFRIAFLTVYLDPAANRAYFLLPADPVEFTLALHEVGLLDIGHRVGVLRRTQGVFVDGSLVPASYVSGTLVAAVSRRTTGAAVAGR